jgi:hypothetical protein
MFLRNLLLSNLLVLLFLNLSKKSIIDCLAKKRDKVENANKKTNLKILEDANLFN